MIQGIYISSLEVYNRTIIQTKTEVLNPEQFCKTFKKIAYEMLNEKEKQVKQERKKQREKISSFKKAQKKEELKVLKENFKELFENLLQYLKNRLL